MFDPRQIVIDAFVARLEEDYRRIYTNLEPSFPGIIAFTARMALENIANTDAPYHDVEHTMLVTLVGQAILRGKHLREGGVTPADWLHFTVSLLCHDIGYVRGVCQGDEDGRYVAGDGGTFVTLPPGATDAALTAHHVARGQVFVRERFGAVLQKDAKRIEAGVIVANIERTRFPVPEANDAHATVDYPGLLRAADLIGQLADPGYLRKLSALHAEFRESGAAERMGLKSAADLRARYPAFYWNAVAPYIGDGLKFLRTTTEGRQWVANLYANVFAEEHKLPASGPERGA